MPYLVYFQDQHICFKCMEILFDNIDDPTLFMLTLRPTYVTAGSKCQKCNKPCDSQESLDAIEHIKDIMA